MVKRNSTRYLRLADQEVSQKKKTWHHLAQKFSLVFLHKQNWDHFKKTYSTLSKECFQNYILPININNYWQQIYLLGVSFFHAKTVMVCSKHGIWLKCLAPHLNLTNIQCSHLTKRLIIYVDGRGKHWTTFIKLLISIFISFLNFKLNFTELYVVLHMISSKDLIYFP